MLTISRTIRSRTGVRALWLIASVATTLLASNVTFADELCGDTTCQKGFVCRSYEMGKCSATPTKDVGEPRATGGTASAPAMVPGAGAAGPSDTYADPVCESYTAYECVPAPCTVDADCADGMVCHTFTNQSCAGSDPMPTCRVDDPECLAKPVETPECTTTTTQQCVARYQLPCTTASDCGPGFTCEEQQSCWCSGSTPASGPAADGSEGSSVAPTRVTSGPSALSVASGAVSSSDGSKDSDAKPVDVSVDAPDCGCAPTGTFECRLQTIACTADVDCPSGLVCVENPNGYCWASSDGTSGCTTPDPAKVCQPRYYQGGVGVSTGQDDALNAGSGGQASVPPTGTGAAAPADDVDLGSDGDDDNGDLSDQVRRHHHHLPGFGCTVATSSDLKPSGLVSLLFGVGLALGIRRRRARK